MEEPHAPGLTRRSRLDRYAAARRKLQPRISHAAFERLVTEALESLPAGIAERIDNVAVVVEEWPTREKLVSLGYDPDRDLLGLYEGVPQPQRGGGYHLAVPDRITIYRQPILDEVGTGGEIEIVREVRDTVVHEVAHHFGISDAEIERIERGEAS